MKLSNINIGGRYHIEKLIASVIIDFIGDATLVGIGNVATFGNGHDFSVHAG